jgi:hypothetical protein
MPKVDAIAINGLKTANLTEDNKSMVFTFQATSGETSLAIPVSEGAGMLRMLMSLLARAEREQKKNPALKYPVAADYWEIGTADNGDMVLTFVLPAGNDLSFRLRKQHGPDMIRVLNDFVRTGNQ